MAESRSDTGLEKAGLLFAPRAAKTAVPHDAEDSHSDADADDPESNARFRKAAHKVQAVQAVSSGILGEKLLRFDAYAQDVEPPSKFGGFLSVVVILSTVAYCAYLVYLFISRPLVVSNQIEWFQGAGPFPIEVECHTTTGCFFSNYLNASWTSVKVGEEQQGCTFLAYREKFVFDMTYTMYPGDGIVAMYVANDTSADVPPGFGFTTRSEANCMPGMCMDGISPLYVPVGPGVSLASYVRTFNTTRDDDGKLRNEWFIVEVDGRRTEVGAGLPCTTEALEARGDGLVQSRIDLQPYFNIITVSRDSNWFGLWGTFGGAYELFLEVGGLVLASAGFLSFMEKLWALISRKKSGQVADHPDAVQRIETV